MAKILYPRGKKSINETASIITIILHEHKENTGEDLFSVIQSEENIQMVTEKEYREITGKKYVPRGYGRAMGGRPSKISENYGKGHNEQGDVRAIVPLPPQEFHWGDIPHESERDSHEHGQDKSAFSQYSLLNLHHKFRNYWEMWEDGYSRAEIAREHQQNIPTVGKWVNLMIEAESAGNLEEWLEIVELLLSFENDRGHSSYKESRQDIVIRFIHSITGDYISDPNNSEKVEAKELVEAYQFACMEENRLEQFEEEESKEEFPPEVDLGIEKARVMIESALIKKLRNTGISFSEKDLLPWTLTSTLPDNLGGAHVFYNSKMGVKNQVLQEIQFGENETRNSKLITMLYSIESELYRVSKFNLEDLEFNILRDEIFKIRDEFSQESWYQLEEQIDWTNRESLLTTMVYYLLELNNLQEEIISSLISQ